MLDTRRGQGEGIKTSEKEKKSDFIFELLEEEWKRRIEVISRTRKLESEDIVTITTLTLNREMGELIQEMEVLTRNIGEVREEMVTRGTLMWGLGIGLTIVTIVISLVTALI